VASKEEVLKAIAIYRAHLEAQRGPKWVKTLPISDEWGNARTIMVLLVRESKQWEHLLSDEKTREMVYQALQQEDLAEV